jgi:hypothetical protein
MEYARITRPVLVRNAANPVLSAADFESQLGIRMRAVYNSSAIKTPDGKLRDALPGEPAQPPHSALGRGQRPTASVGNCVRNRSRCRPTRSGKRVTRSVYYDPRITYIDGEYKVLIACEGDQHCRVALFTFARSRRAEFVNYINVPDNRNMVIFPEKSADGRYMRLERPRRRRSAARETSGSALARSHPLGRRARGAQIVTSSGITASAASGLPRCPIASEGWLVLFHGIMNNCTTRE